MNKFYTIGGSYRRNAIFVDIESDYDEYEAFLDANIFKRIEENFKVSKGEKLFDIVQLRYDSFNFFISKRMKKILEENNIRGCDYILKPIDKIEEDYYLFHVNGKAGKITNLDKINNLEASNREFDIATWDGSEVFNLKDSAVIVCTQKVKDLLDLEKISNLEIDPL